MSEALQEFVDSRRERLRVDRAAGVIRGVKLLGISSRNGRRYRETALAAAAGLYEGAKVNINHPKGHPLSPRDYQDRLGEIRGVEYRAGDGLFGNLHFNPKHALSEQLMWDAQHASQNVGLSHNVLARTVREGDETVVEAITKVQSIDLVADPASTTGLFEHVGRQEPPKGYPVESREPESGDSPLAALDSKLLTLDSLTIDELELHRPDLVRELVGAQQSQLEDLRRELDAYAAQEAASARRERIATLLEEHGLPLPSAVEDSAGSIVSRAFLQSLLGAGDDKTLRRLVEERAALVRSASDWKNTRGGPTDRRPRSRDQAAVSLRDMNGRPQNAREFAAAVRGH